MWMFIRSLRLMGINLITINTCFDAEDNSISLKWDLGKICSDKSCKKEKHEFNS